MTRFARKGASAMPKKPHEASTWTELKNGWKLLCSRCHRKGHSTEECETSKGVVKSGVTQGNVPGMAIGTTQKEKKDKNHLAKKRERRRVERRMKRLRQKEESKVCDFCSEGGHQAKECPCRITDNNFGSCIHCGSTEHTANECKGLVKHGSCSRCHRGEHELEDCPLEEEEHGFVPIRCPLCRELGHKITSCPDNPRSIYPLGGCCSECQSVEHKASQCPERQSTNDVEEVRVGTHHYGCRESADAIDDDFSSTTTSVKTKIPKKHKSKVVLF